MKTETCNNADDVASKCADIIAREMLQAIDKRGQFTIAFSGGRSPLPLFRKLSELALPWDKVHVFQVDERIAPDGDENRNFTSLKACLLDHVSIPSPQIHPIPVALIPLSQAAQSYEALLIAHNGSPPQLDVIHLGMGEDGHTASLIPLDPALDISDSYVAISQDYNHFKRLTLTYGAINAARCILWQITGKNKAPMLERLKSGDTSIPAGRVSRDQSIVVTDIQ